jgi:SAM-dependent methyltransferase
LQNWLKTPPGRLLLDWENTQFQRVVADIFGYHAVQLGLPDLNALQASRIPHQWVAVAEVAIDLIANNSFNTRASAEEEPKPIAFVTDYTALPFSENSLDLFILPHSLELSSDPHATLREAERVLRPEGKLIICGFNPISLWGLKQKRSHIYKRFGRGDLYLPEAGEFIGHKRLLDWLALLNFEAAPTLFGCYRPAVRSEAMLQRFAWMDRLGSKYGSIFGAVYFVTAVKRVRGLRMIRPVKKRVRLPGNAPISVANKTTNTRL